MKKSFLITIFCLFAAGCSLQNPQNPMTGEDRTARMTVDLSSLKNQEGIAMEDLLKLVLTVEGPDMQPIKQTITDTTIDPLEFNVEVPMGRDRIFKIVAVFDGLEPQMALAGRTRTDIDSEEETVPIHLIFVNFAADAVGDVFSMVDPDLVFVIFTVNDRETPDPSDDFVIIDLTFVSPTDPDTLVFILEFNTDGDPDTGRAQTLISKLIDGTKIVTNFQRGSDLYLIIEASGVPHTPFAFHLFNKDNVAVTIEPQQLAQITGGFPDTADTTHWALQLSRPLFSSLIDPNGSGDLNILVGTKAKGANLSTLDFSTFIPTDIFLDQEEIGLIHYETNLNTDNL